VVERFKTRAVLATFTFVSRTGTAGSALRPAAGFALLSPSRYAWPSLRTNQIEPATYKQPALAAIRYRTICF
jgi:hypothetical protein